MSGQRPDASRERTSVFNEVPGFSITLEIRASTRGRSSSWASSGTSFQKIRPPSSQGILHPRNSGDASRRRPTQTRSPGRRRGLRRRVRALRRFSFAGVADPSSPEALHSADRLPGSECRPASGYDNQRSGNDREAPR
jgi:hypothetical protein